MTKWISKAIKHPGAFRKETGTKTGHNIPEATIKADEKKPGKLGRRARLAEKLRNLRGKKK